MYTFKLHLFYILNSIFLLNMEIELVKYACLVKFFSWNLDYYNILIGMQFCNQTLWFKRCTISSFG